MAYTLDVLLTQDSVIIQEKYFNFFYGAIKLEEKWFMKSAWLYIYKYT